jgi:hypothetical protein
MKTYYEDPSSPLKTVNYEVPVAPEDELRFEQRADEERYAVLDAAVARGAIPRESCPRWAARLMEDFDYTAEVLADLPDDADAAEKAYESDGRIRDAEAAYLDLLGVEPQERQYAESLSPGEEQYREYAAALNLRVA